MRCNTGRMVALVCGVAAAFATGCNTFRDTGSLDDDDAGGDSTDASLPAGCDTAQATPQAALAPFALYNFDALEGATVVDCAGRLPVPLSLEIVAAPASATALFAWLQPGLRIDDHLRLVPGSSLPFYDALDAGGDFTIEMWVDPVSAAQTGPARLLAAEPGVLEANVTIGVELDALEVRFRTSSTNAEGFLFDASNPDIKWPALLAAGAVSAELTHIALTYDLPDDAVAEASLSLYVNGGVVAHDPAFPGVRQWNQGFPLQLANTTNGDRQWRGTFYRLALYDRALTPAEIASLATQPPGTSP